MPVFQKPLGWVQRYLYNIEAGQLPFPQLTLPIDLDWPRQVYRAFNSFSSVAGTTNQNILQPPAEFHAIMTHLSLGYSAAIPATDTVGLIYNFASGAQVRLSAITGTVFGGQYISLIGGVSWQNTSGMLMGIDPVYVQPGDSLQVEVSSAAGGLTIQAVGMYQFRQKSLPIRYP